MILLLYMLLAMVLAIKAASYSPNPFRNIMNRDSRIKTSAAQVDLGYAIYEGTHNALNRMKEWKGIRFAAPPTGALRWQAPQPPTINRSAVIQATAIPNQCPQSNFNYGEPTNSGEGSEDCLYLSVFAPEDAQNLPVLVWIHGGGYGLGNGSENLVDIITTSNGSFIGVTIQYRLGAFGFLSSDEVNRFGVVNAGIRDQHFALQWVQSYIHLFGGNASQVTISGESAGGGSVMIQALAYGGTLGTSLFTNVIAASPYLPMQYNYNDWVPSQAYYAFAKAAGCFSGYAAGSPASKSVFMCLVSKDTGTLQSASNFISTSGTYGTWSFLPVTDGVFIQQLPSQQLQKKQVNGLRLLSGNNALEGPDFVPQNISTEQDLLAFIRDTFPLFTTDAIFKALQYYPSNNVSDSSDASKFATLGNVGPTANNQSSIATGQQQRANNIYSEAIFICPSYWLAEAFTERGRVAYKYQYSVPAALHGADVYAYFGPATPAQGPDFVRAFRRIWSNFISENNPSIPISIAIGESYSASLNYSNSITDWPAFTNEFPYQINLNETGGQEFNTIGIDFKGKPINVTEYRSPGLQNNFTLADAWSWEGGRGVRCDFWRSMGVLVPE